MRGAAEFFDGYVRGLGHSKAMTYSDAPNPDRFNFRNPADTFANIPGILGYFPKEKVILVTATDSGYLPGPVLSRPIDGLDAPDLLDATADVLRAEGVTDVHIYFVTKAVQTEQCSYLMWLAAVLRNWLADSGIEVGEVFAADIISTGRRFISLTNPNSGGTIAEVERSWSARRADQAGEPIAGSKTELDRRFQVRPPSVDGSWERLVRQVLTECIATVAAQLHPSAPSAPNSLLCDAMSQTGAVLANIDEGGLNITELHQDTEALRALLLPLTHTTLRDMLFALCNSPLRATARETWLELARLTTDHVRANALVLYAVERFECGAEGVGHAALAAALAAAPEHRLAQLIQTALVYDDISGVVGGMIATSSELVETATELAS